MPSGPKMANSFWGVVLAVGAASAAITYRRTTPLSYKMAVRLSVDLYNQHAGDKATFLLYKAIPHPEWDANSANAQELDFTLKEAVCLPPKSNPTHLEENNGEEEECRFKAHGLFKRCFGYAFLDEEPPAAVLTCRVIDAEKPKHPRRVKRFKKLKKRIKKLKKRLKKIGRRVRKRLRKTIRKIITKEIVMVAGKLIVDKTVPAIGKR